MFVGGLCLEIYIVQGTLLPMMHCLDVIFPLNYIIVFITIVLCAYLLKCSTRFLTQTFSDKPYNWPEIIKPI